MKEDHDMKDIYERYAKKVQQENDLIHHRMVWFVTLQSFLFTSLALFTNGTFFGDLRGWIFFGFAGIGAASAAFTLISVASAYDAMRDTRDQWHKGYPDESKCKEYPALMGGVANAALPKRGRMLAQALPCVVICFWLGVAFLSSIASENSSSADGTPSREATEKPEE